MRSASWIIVCLVFVSTIIYADNSSGRGVASETVPNDIKAKLDTAGCKFTTMREGTYTSGEFAVEGQKDWAFLCPQKAERYSVVIFWGGAARCPEIKETFSARVPVRKITPDQILKMPDAMIPKLADRVEHDFLVAGDGVETRWYCENGKWNSDVAGDL